MDKLDAALAARQIAWLADLTRRIDRVPAAELRKGDPTLGLKTSAGGGSPAPKKSSCKPAR